MSLLEKYACLYGEVEFTKEEVDEISDFAAGVAKLAGNFNASEWQTLAHRHFDYVQASALEKVARYCEYLSVVEGSEDERIRRAIEGETFQKEAAPVMPAPPSTVMSLTRSGLLPAIGVAAVGLPLLMSGLESLTRRYGLSRSLDKIMKEHPELRNDPNAGRYFQAIADFAPSVATNPLLAGNVMRQLHQIGPAALTPAMIKDLLGVQETASKMRQTPQNIKDLGQSIIEMSKALPKAD